jgi:hypothetical protein
VQLSGVRRALILLALAVPLPLAGCGALGLGAPATGASSAPTPPATGDSWIVVETGRPTPSPKVTVAKPSPSASPSFLALAGGGCNQNWKAGEVLIPMVVTVGRGSITATWPRYGTTSNYRLAAVPQKLVLGDQPALDWKPIANTGGCDITGTVTGLTAGEPYILWLDAPNTGYLLDGTRNPYSGRSGVVYPR